MTQRLTRRALAAAYILGIVVLIQASRVATLDTNFDMVFKYGVKKSREGPVNRLDTIKGTFTQDMVMDPPVTTELHLTPEDKGRVLDKMEEIGFFYYPRRFKVHVHFWEVIGIGTPYSSYYFKVVSRGVTVKELYWDDEIWNENERAENLRELIKLIIEIIVSKPEYQSLPEPQSGYI